MTQVRQWNQHRPADCVPPAHPTVKFRDMKASLSVPQTGQKRKVPPGTDEGNPHSTPEDDVPQDQEKQDSDSDEGPIESDEEDFDDCDTADLQGEWTAASYADLRSQALRDVLSPESCLPAPTRTQPKAPQTKKAPRTTVVTDADWII
ncbi:hypothetical protein PsYK624_044990 [Phanerochaete sordida]|uniref:Uncharacterized protein n=1 Tax=Phanerochaete sordida TaxID=48140 RepID=A0A9P3G517_9APHY|nr:hypothetical protein PsYK624_044990 [Phanerochaete sordida]